MLDDVVRVSWRDAGGSDVVAIPQAELPARLALLGTDDCHDSLKLSKRHGDAVRLLVGGLYRESGVLLLDMPVEYWPRDGSIRIRAAERDDVRARLTAAAGADLIRIPRRQIGIGPMHRDPWIGSHVCAALEAGEESDLWLAPSVEAIIRTSGLAVPRATEPDALVFHTDVSPVTITLVIEPTTVCNFDCQFCYGRRIAQGTMTWETFTSTLDRLAGLAAVEFTGEGEPLLNRLTPRMIKECKRRGLWVHLTTNGSLVTDERLSMIFELGIDALAVSLESVDPDRYARLRPGGALQDVRATVQELRRLREYHGYGPELVLWVTVHRQTLHEIDDILRFGREVGADRVEFQALNRIEAYRRNYDKELDQNVLEPAELLAASQDPGRSAESRRTLADLASTYSGRTCDIFMNSVMVYWQGDVTPCRLLKVPQHPAAGNVRNQSFHEIWNESGFSRLRFALMHGVVLKSCEHCACVESLRGSSNDFTAPAHRS